MSLYGIVREHLATFLAHTERDYAAPLPRHVVENFEQDLACGDRRGAATRPKVLGAMDRRGGGRRPRLAGRVRFAGKMVLDLRAGPRPRSSGSARTRR